MAARAALTATASHPGITLIFTRRYPCSSAAYTRRVSVSGFPSSGMPSATPQATLVDPPPGDDERLDERDRQLEQLSPDDAHGSRGRGNAAPRRVARAHPRLRARALRRRGRRSDETPARAAPAECASPGSRRTR